MMIFHALALQGHFTPVWTFMMIVTNILPVIWFAFLFRKDHRGLHDLLAKTVVVGRK